MTNIKNLYIVASILVSSTTLTYAADTMNQGQINKLYTENSIRLNNNVLCNDVKQMAKALKADQYKLGVLARSSDKDQKNEIYMFVNSITGNYIITKTFHSKKLNRDLSCIIAKGEEVFFNAKEDIAIKKLSDRKDGAGASGWVKVVPSIRTFKIQY